MPIDDHGDTKLAEEPLRDLYHKVRIFEGLSKNDFETIIQQMHMRRVGKGNLVVDRLDVERDVYYVLSGSFRAISFSEDGKETFYRDITEGEFFGEFSAIDSQARSTSVVAVTDGCVFRQSQSAFNVMLSHYPSVSRLLLQHLTQRIRYLVNRVRELSTQSVERRLCSELLRMSGYGTGRSELIINPFPKHHELANWIGTHREAVTRILGVLNEKGVIQKSGRAMRILRPHDLA